MPKSKADRFEPHLSFLSGFSQAGIYFRHDESLWLCWIRNFLAGRLRLHARRNTASSAACCSFPRRSNITRRWIKNSFWYGSMRRPPRHVLLLEPYLTKVFAALRQKNYEACPRPTYLNWTVPNRMPRNQSRNISQLFPQGTACRKVHVVACPSLQEEIRFAAGKILRLVREKVCASANCHCNKRHGDLRKESARHFRGIRYPLLY